ncbi:MAG: hypothetical protein AAFR61_31975, partial [Bacteroidota bacterium]
MRNPKLNRFLVPLVVLIWMGVIWRFFFAEEKSPERPEMAMSVGTSFATPVPDTFSLLLSYPDPFSAKRVPPPTRKPIARGPKVITKAEPPAPKPPLDMHYIGYVQGTDTTQATA